MRRVGNLWPQIVDFDNLLHAALRAMRGKRHKDDVATFAFQLESHLLSLQDEISCGTYQPGEYRAFWIHDPKRRLISAAPFRDRVIHHAVCRIVEPLLDRTFIFHTYANRVGKGTHAALDQASNCCRKAMFVLKCDVSKFFPSIDHEVLMSLLERKVKCQPTLDLLRTIIAASNPQEPVRHVFPGDDLLTPLEHRIGLPIGNLTSQCLANVMLDPVDHYVKETLGMPLYVRFADDFLIFEDNKNRLHDILAQLHEFLARYRLKLHPRKCVVQRVADGVPFLGWRLFPTHRLLKRSAGVRFQRRLRGLCEAYADGLISWDEIRQVLASWNGHLEHGDTWGLRSRLFSDSPFVRPKESER